MYENQNQPMQQNTPQPEFVQSPVQEVDQSRMVAYLSRVFGWMFVGLLVTSVVAFATATSRSAMSLIFSSEYTFYGIFIAQIGVALGFSVGLQKMNSAVATILFMLYSALTGVTFSVLFYAFEMNSLIFVFGLTSLIFAAMAIYGSVTKRDLTSIGRLAIFGLLGLIGANLLNVLLFKSSPADMVITSIGVVVFIVLIAYDTQKIKNFYLFAVAERDADEHSDPINKIAIYGAFCLYLDFINLFLKLLRLLGKRKN
ncbi:Bax inhibitor-1/YccA family protein [Oscillospiraceae bacterium MB08-C2-2]|nr:Bax inhibitor-1/YccA family protein [Oscillospiraceae bacterium MB08-C2-2]